MITAARWVPRGHAAEVPVKYQLTEEEYERIGKSTKIRLEAARSLLKNDQAPDRDSTPIDNGDAMEICDPQPEPTPCKIDEDLKEYNLENYDDDEDSDTGGGNFQLAMFSLANGQARLGDEEQDPYITLEQEEEFETEERNELQILETDNLILATRVEDDVAHLEVYVYEDLAANLYVHHDIMLPDIPIAVEWINHKIHCPHSSQQGGQFVAVGTMGPDIELWNLDMVDAIHPDVILGSPLEIVDSQTSQHHSNKKKTKKNKNSEKSNESYHIDAVLALSANRKISHLLASGSADKTIKIWDLNSARCVSSYSHHTDKVCAIAWNHAQSAILISGSYDRSVVCVDSRAPSDHERARWVLESDVETVRWDPHSDSHFYVTTESGMVHYYDFRKTQNSVWSLQAHDSAVSSFDANPSIPGFLVTGSTDKRVKLWRVGPIGEIQTDGEEARASQRSHGEGKSRRHKDSRRGDTRNARIGPTMIVSRDQGVGKVFATSFAPDEEVAFRLLVAGSKGSVQVWDTSTNAAVRSVFGKAVPVSMAETPSAQPTQNGGEEGEGFGDADGSGGTLAPLFDRTVILASSGDEDEDEEEENETDGVNKGRRDHGRHSTAPGDLKRPHLPGARPRPYSHGSR